MTAPGLADLHVHFFGSVRPGDLLRYLASCDRIDWQWYEDGMAAVYGTVPPARAVVERFRAGDPTAIADFERIAVFSDRDSGSFERFQAKGRLYFAGMGLDEVSGEQALLRLVRGIRDDLVCSEVHYAEIRTSPRPSVLAEYAHDESVLVQRVAVSVERDDPWDLWEQACAAALGPHGHVLTGIDFCGVEEGHPPSGNAELFAEIKAFNAAHPERAFAILYHVGESFGDKSIESAIRWVHEAAAMGAHRLGHAIALGVEPAMYGEHLRYESVAERRDQIAYDLQHEPGLRTVGVEVDRLGLKAELAALKPLPATDCIRLRYDTQRLAEVRRRQEYAMACVRRLGVVIEVCPTSNRRIAGIHDAACHPVRRFLANDVPFVVCSDDAGMLGITLAEELDWVCQQTGGGDELRRHLIDLAWRSRSECLTGRCHA